MLRLTFLNYGCETVAMEVTGALKSSKVCYHNNEPQILKPSYAIYRQLSVGAACRKLPVDSNKAVLLP